ncbi:MAG: glycosyltransferase family 2 protein [Chloroflexi bacterium]|nr:glycosyltransferase family 2 protein [Chloroflexota bacterium]
MYMTPKVSIIVPCYNEQDTIRLLLDALLAQTTPLSLMEVVIADGLSQDKTRAVIAAFQGEHPALALRILDNQRLGIPSALNLVISAARGEIIIRLDAHSIPAPDYVERCVKALEAGKGANVGGVWIIRPGGSSWIAEAIAAAAANPLGVGDAMYRLAPNAGPVDTVPFGAFHRELIEKIGAFDETLLANEDYEFNTRLRQSGGIVWLDPQIRSTYFARATLGALAAQYWNYGFWKFKMLSRYPNTIRWRQALPPLFVASLIGLFILSFLFDQVKLVLIFEIVIYFAALTLAGLHQALRQHKPLFIPGLPLAIMVMHLSWGSGFLWSIVSKTSKNG